jgi:1,4-dihydroxy-2-naphthoate polyprenyltransferase
MSQPSLVIKEHIVTWAKLGRLPFHSVGVLPFVLGIVIAWSRGYALNWGLAVLSTLAVVLIMLTTYLAGEYYDFETDSLNAEFNKFSGGSRVLQKGVVARRTALTVAILSAVLAGIIGLVIQFYYKTGPYTIPLGVFGLICGYFYSSNPIRWAYTGIGEILIGICYGWLTVNTAYYLQTDTFALVPSLVAIPIAISIFLVIFINEYPDYVSDRISKKNNMVVRWGPDRSAIVYAVLAVLCFISIPLGVLGGVPKLMAVLSVIPLALVVLNIAALKRRAYRESHALEVMCGITLILNLGTTLLYIIAFAV